MAKERIEEARHLWTEIKKVPDEDFGRHPKREQLRDLDGIVEKHRMLVRIREEALGRLVRMRNVPLYLEEQEEAVLRAVFSARHSARHNLRIDRGENGDLIPVPGADPDGRQRKGLQDVLAALKIEIRREDWNDKGILAIPAPEMDRLRPLVEGAPEAREAAKAALLHDLAEKDMESQIEGHLLACARRQVGRHRKPASRQRA